MEDAADIYDALENVPLAPADTILIEMYRSAGYLNKHAQATIEMVGAIKLISKLIFWTPAVMRAEQARISGQREAAELMGASIEFLRADPGLKDAFSALSHCCSYRRELLNGSH
jgi:hypothetical protein